MVKTGVLDLSLKPSERWMSVTEKYRADIPKLKKLAHKLISELGVIGAMCRGAHSMVGDQLEKIILHREELTFWAKLLDLKLMDMVLIQLMYEVHAGCTTVVTDNFIFRTMDWELPELRKFTIELEVRRGEEIVGKAVTWLGYIGFLTIITPKEFVAVNYRRGDADYFTMLHRVLQGFWPVSYLVRDKMERGGFSRLREARLISSSYITYVQRSKAGHDMILTRSSLECDDVEVRESGKCLVCVNCDRDKDTPDIMESVARRKLIGKLPLKNWKELLVDPIINSNTIYYTVVTKDTTLVNVVE